MARKPLIAGNWKMNLNHLEAISTVQKLAFALPKEYYEKVDVAVTVPFTDLRSVQTLVEGDKLEITYGAQDIFLVGAAAHGHIDVDSERSEQSMMRAAFLRIL